LVGTGVGRPEKKEKAAEKPKNKVFGGTDLEKLTDGAPDDWTTWTTSWMGPIGCGRVGGGPEKTKKRGEKRKKGVFVVVVGLGKTRGKFKREIGTREGKRRVPPKRRLRRGGG